VHRNIIGTSGFSIGRYHAGPEKTVVVEEKMAGKCREEKKLRIIFNRRERCDGSTLNTRKGAG
jgi:hypothetical protein